MASQQKQDSEPAKPKRPYRETIEGIVVAIVMAVFLKYFVVEAYKIPSGSMQPTLMGSPETGVFDRILVDKFSYHMRDPERFEVVVFRHPLNRSLNMIKRLVGMPGESLRIYNGDLWTRAIGSTKWDVLRRPDGVQEDMWRALFSSDRWSTSSAGWSTTGDNVEARGDGEVLFPPSGVSVTNRYTDGYPPKVAAETRGTPPRAGRYNVGDLRLEGSLRALPGCTEVQIELREGLRRYLFCIPGPAAAADAVCEIRVEGVAGLEGLRSDSAWKLGAGETLEFAVENLDDRLHFSIADMELDLDVMAASESGQQSGFSLRNSGEGADFTDLKAYRDIYYIRELRQSVWDEIPEGEYVVLGDNTLDSADTRDWSIARIEVTEEGADPIEMEGNERRTNRPDDSNPYTTADTYFFRDKWGEQHAFPRSSVRELPSLKGPTVPRNLITGRAVLVFWPLSFSYETYRWKWIQ